jgi:hypothetical protein
VSMSILIFGAKASLHASCAEWNKPREQKTFARCGSTPAPRQGFIENSVGRITKKSNCNPAIRSSCAAISSRISSDHRNAKGTATGPSVEREVGGTPATHQPSRSKTHAPPEGRKSRLTIDLVPPAVQNTDPEPSGRSNIGDEAGENLVQFLGLSRQIARCPQHLRCRRTRVVGGLADA